jgi:hypothetical protein
MVGRMKKLGTFAGIALAVAAFAAGCGVGPYHIPKVDPVVMPEPEEDLFADLDFGGGSGETAAEPTATEEPAQAEAAPAASSAAPEAAPPPAEAPPAPKKKK